MTPMRERLARKACERMGLDPAAVEPVSPSGGWPRKGDPFEPAWKTRGLPLVDAILGELREPGEEEPHTGPLYEAANALHEAEGYGSLEPIGAMRGTYRTMMDRAQKAIAAYVDAVREGK